jgi:Flp pilus assembly protein TadG
MLKDQEGAAIVEFAIVLPLILLIMLGVMQFAWFLNSYMILANATAVGARFFATQASSSTAYSDTKNKVILSGPGLTNANLVIATGVAGTPCTDPNCGTALIAKAGLQATVTATYTFTPLIQVPLLSPLTLLPGCTGSLGSVQCTLTSSMAERAAPVQS